MRRLRFDRIPLVLAATFVAVCTVITVWNLSVAAVFPRIAIRNWNQLYGLAEQKPPAFNLANFLAGDLQTGFSRQIGATLPIYAPAVRVRNQVEYSIFDLPNAPSVAFGRDKRLYEWAYINEYCGRNGETNARTLAEWADKINDIQDYATSHGKAFVYLITPSKAAVYPEHLPDNHLCPAVLRGTTNKLPPYDRALDERRIHYIEGANLMAAERDRHEIELFPRGGTHWNALGARLATTQLVSLIKGQNSDLDLDSVSTLWTESRSPEGTDRDLVNMLNLYWFDTDYPVPKIARNSSAIEQACRPAKIMEVGGSFLEQVNVALRDSRCPPEISYWFYWNFAHVSYPNGKRQSAPPSDEDRLADLAGSDVLLLEENEFNIGETEHLKALHALVVSATRMTSTRDAPARR
jgi:alginate O-acetyltransferase complex protein AlgJ